MRWGSDGARWPLASVRAIAVRMYNRRCIRELTAMLATDVQAQPQTPDLQQPLAGCLDLEGAEPTATGCLAAEIEAA